MGRRSYRNRFFSDIYPVVQAKAVDGREATLYRCGGQMRNVQVYPAVRAAVHLRRYGPGNHIPGCQVGQRMVVGHKGPAGVIPQHCPLPSHRFGEQKGGRPFDPQGGGVKLVELHIHDRGTGHIPQGNAIAGGHFRISRIFERLPGATGTNYYRLSGKSLPSSGFAVKGFHSHRTALFYHQFRRQGKLQNFDI